MFYPVYLSGVLLKTFGVLIGVPSNIYDITISDDGDTLALACGKDGVRLYEITKQHSSMKRLFKENYICSQLQCKIRSYFIHCFGINWCNFFTGKTGYNTQTET